MRVMQTAEALSKLGTIPQVVAQQDVIQQVRAEEFWEHATLIDFENVRGVLRD